MKTSAATVSWPGQVRKVAQIIGLFAVEILYLLVGAAASWMVADLAARYPGAPGLYWGERLGLSAVLILVAAWDWAKEIIPNWVTLPLMAFGVTALVLRWRAGTLPGDAIWIFVVAWAICLWAGSMEFFQPGDVKLAMAVLAIFPDMRLVWILLAVLLAGSLLAMSLMHGRAGWQRFGAVLVRAATMGKLPSREENRAAVNAPGGAHRSGWMFSLAALAFLWLFF